MTDFNPESREKAIEKGLIIPEDGNPDFVSDGYHTFAELYDFRLAYNAALFNEWANGGKYRVHKSQRHADGELCFGRDDYFVVTAMLPDGQVSNHYNMEFWDLFDIPEQDKVLWEYDGHSPQDVLDRIKAIL